MSDIRNLKKEIYLYRRLKKLTDSFDFFDDEERIKYNNFYEKYYKAIDKKNYDKTIIKFIEEMHESYNNCDKMMYDEDVHVNIQYLCEIIRCLKRLINVKSSYLS